MSNEGWLWPQSWLLKAPNLATVEVPKLLDMHVDLPQWRDSKGVMSMFSVRGAWEALHPRGNEITWYHIVWFSHNIPRHAFNLWLIMRRSLKTQDRARQWDVGPNVDLNTLCCKLCDAQTDSHEHLFFECPYAARIWILIRSLGGMELISPRLHDIISYLQPIAHPRNARSVIGQILVAAAAYFIWVELNNRVFKNSTRSPEELRDAIIVTVQLKLLLNLYVMKLGNKPKDKICLATIDENSTLWHRRLGHANMRLIQSLASKEIVRNLPKLKFDQHFCDACKIGKQAHASHKAKNIVSKNRCLKLLHMDLFGPSSVRSYGGN
ncbi:putative reverse transcriptase domain-containing protein [Tanacetum coccineum]|uniref:Reverse transcriptase domain-containing protein n=1 Tax=Tanacetum coccineum TaxID=301880 RepID=A0ABQ5FQ53_9ASTR